MVGHLGDDAFRAANDSEGTARVNRRPVTSRPTFKQQADAGTIAVDSGGQIDSERMPGRRPPRDVQERRLRPEGAGRRSGRHGGWARRPARARGEHHLPAVIIAQTASSRHRTRSTRPKWSGVWLNSSRKSTGSAGKMGC